MNAALYATTQVQTIAPGDSIDKAMSLMEEFRIHHLVVVSGDHVVGMISDRDILISCGWMLSSQRALPGKSVAGPLLVEQIMSRPVVSIHSSESAALAARVLIDRKISALPVLEHGGLLGILSESDFLRALRQVARPGNAADGFMDAEVSRFMRAKVVTVAPSAVIEEIVDLFRRRRIRHVPVAMDRRLIGMISDRDIRRALGRATVRDMQAQDRGAMFSGATTAMEIMTGDVLTIALQSRIREAVHLMLENRVHALPVLQGDHLVGIITETDLIREVARSELL